MEAITTKTVGEIVAENYLLSDVFLKHGIDFCCQGDRTLEEVCRQKALNAKDIEIELSKIERQGHRTHHFHNWKLDYLIDHIINTHHYFVWVNLPVIKEYTLKAARMLSTLYPRTIEVNRLFKELASELERHMLEEEQTLFPYIKAQTRQIIEIQDFQSSLKMTLYRMELEHEHMGAVLKMIGLLTSDFNHKEAPDTLKVLYAKLKDFQDDFYQHAHLENNILFPKALGLEKGLVLKN